MPLTWWKKATREQLDFDPATVPWIDRAGARREIARRAAAALITPAEADLLAAWHHDGAVILRQAIEPALIDQMLADYERGWRERPTCLVEGISAGPALWATALERTAITTPFRLMDFHNLSQAAAHIMMHPAVMRFCQLAFDDIPVGMQTLFFEYGTEQDAHQDFAYVHTGIASHLIGAWAACEDIGSKSGPLFFYPGSHRIPKFDFGRGNIRYAYDNPRILEDFSNYLLAECERRGLPKQVFLAQKGDVLLWHGAVVHGGLPINDPNRSRRSLASHYSSQQAYPRDRRQLDGGPSSAISLNGGIYYQWQHPGHQEGRYPLGRDSFTQ